MIGSRDEEELERHYALVTRLLAESRVVPFLGAGANLCGRPLPGTGGTASDSSPAAPSCRTPGAGWEDCQETELTRVAQWVSRWAGRAICSTPCTAFSIAITRRHASTRSSRRCRR